MRRYKYQIKGETEQEMDKREALEDGDYLER